MFDAIKFGHQKKESGAKNLPGIENSPTFPNRRWCYHKADLK
jgi:hypothetical protein